MVSRVWERDRQSTAYNGIEPLLEAHVFDFSGDLYGRPIEVEFVAKLRDEIKFDSLDAMIVQMRVDAEQARDLLSKVDCD
jgi:riboflavin kinase/FMN adenylyltransferase